MKIAIATTENHLKSDINVHFGRADWFCLYDVDTQSHTFIENPVRYDKEKAGCSVAEILLDNGVNLVVAGRFGTKVSDFFRDNNVQMMIPQKDITLIKLLNKLKKS